MSFLRGALALCILTLADAMAAAAEPLGPSASVVVLRNGEVFQGQVEKLGEQYVVSLVAGAKVHLPAADVDLHCRNLDEAYCKKRDYISPDDARKHLDLAEWCLRQGLKRRAADELSAALAADPEEPRIAPFEKRLRESLAAPPTAKPTLNVSTPAKADELELAIRSVPPSAVERFTNSVQPLLLNRCSTSRCHGTTSKSSFKLLRPAAGDTITRRYTQRNLHAVLQLIDRAAPEASPLLTSPRGVHGNTTSPVFSQREERQYEQLVQWVKLAVEAPASRNVAKASSSEARPFHVADAHAYRTYLKPPLATSETTSKPKSQSDDEPRKTAAKSAEGRKSVSPFPAPPPASQPVSQDPFDPELFNRRFHGEKE